MRSVLSQEPETTWRQSGVNATTLSVVLVCPVAKSQTRTVDRFGHGHSFADGVQAPEVGLLFMETSPLPTRGSYTEVAFFASSSQDGGQAFSS
jgi:hypothetical protein